MLIRLGYDIRFDIGQPVPIVALLSVHPSRPPRPQRTGPVTIEPEVPSPANTATSSATSAPGFSRPPGRCGSRTRR